MIRKITEAVKGPSIDWYNYLTDSELFGLKLNLRTFEGIINTLLKEDRIELGNKTYEDLVDELTAWWNNHSDEIFLREAKSSLPKVKKYYWDFYNAIKDNLDNGNNIELDNSYWDEDESLNMYKELKKHIQSNIRLRDMDLNLNVINKEKYDLDNKIDSIMLDYVNKRVHSLSESKELLLEKGRNDFLNKTRRESPGRWQRRQNYKDFRFVKADIKDLDDKDMVVAIFEVGDYTVIVSFNNILLNLREIVKKDPKHMVKFDWVLRACNRAIDQSDIYVNCTCLDPDTKIKLLNGKVVTIKEMKDMYENDEELWVYSVDEKGDFKPGKVTNVWISNTTKELIEVELDNGKKIRTTENHLYMKRSGEYVRADQLHEGDSLMPLYFINNPKFAKGYEQVKLNSNINQTIYDSVYKIVAEEYFNENDFEEAKLRSGEDCIVIHHKDFHKENNYPSNLKLLGKEEHLKLHGKLIKDLWNNIEFRKKQSERARKWMKNLNNNPTEKMIESRRSGENIKNLRKYWEIPGNQEKLNKINSRVQKELWRNYTEDEKRKRLKNHPMHKQENRDKISKSNKKVWENYTEFEYNKRCNINKISNEKGKEIQKEKRINYWKNLSNEERKKHINNSKKSNIKGQIIPKINKYNYSDKEKEEKIELITSLRLRIIDIKKEKGLIKTNRTFDKIGKVLEEMILNNKLFLDENYYNSRKTLKEKTNKNYPDYKNYYESFEDLLYDYNLAYYNHKVKSIKRIKLDEPIEVYDLTVDKYNNFYTDAGVILHNCKDFKYRFSYVASKNSYKYGKKELRPADIRNPDDNIGAACKHLLSVLSNKNWMTKVATTVNDWLQMKDVYEIRDLLHYEEANMPTEISRDLGKQSATAKGVHNNFQYVSRK